MILREPRHSLWPTIESEMQLDTSLRRRLDRFSEGVCLIEHFPERLRALRVDLGVVRLEVAALAVVAGKRDVGANSPAVQWLIRPEITIVVVAENKV